MAPVRKSINVISPLVVKGLMVGYLYSIFLSASAVVVCEMKGKSDCSSTWAQAYSVSTGLVTTLLAYFVQPETKSDTRRETDASQS